MTYTDIVSFKSVLDRGQFYSYAPAPLRAFLECLSLYRANHLDNIPLTVTSFHREKKEGDAPSFHHDNRAIDIRTHDISAGHLVILVGYARILAKQINVVLKDDAIEIDAHDVGSKQNLIGTPNAHIHIELDDGRYHAGKVIA